MNVDFTHLNHTFGVYRLRICSKLVSKINPDQLYNGNGYKLLQLDYFQFGLIANHMTDFQFSLYLINI